MAEILCGYTADRDEILVAYLYGEINPSQRAAFEVHVASCDRCRHELADLERMRTRLQDWTLPETSRLSVLEHSSEESPAPGPSSGRILTMIREMPAWAQVAAALLFLGVSAGIANFDVRYDHDGLVLRTGWSRTPASIATGASPTATTAAPWQADLEALEQRLQTESRAASSSAREAADSSADADLIRRVRALIQESERKQQNELALRIGEVARDFDTKRGTDLANIDRSLRTIQSDTGIQILQQQQRLNYLTRVSLQR